MYVSIEAGGLMLSRERRISKFPRPFVLALFKFCLHADGCTKNKKSFWRHESQTRSSQATSDGSVGDRWPYHNSAGKEGGGKLLP